MDVAELLQGVEERPKERDPQRARFTVIADGEHKEIKTPVALDKWLGVIRAKRPTVFRNAAQGITD